MASSSSEFQTISPPSPQEDLSTPPSPQLECSNDKDVEKATKIQPEKEIDNSFLSVYQCQICGMKMKNHFQLNSHKRVHIRDGSVTATQRGKGLVKPKNREYQCKICNQPFKNRFSLISHMRVHKVKTENCSPSNVQQAISQIKEEATEELALTPRFRLERKNYHSLHHGSVYRVSNNSRSRSQSIDVTDDDNDDAETIDMNMREDDTRNEEKFLQPFQCWICKFICKNIIQLNAHMRSHKHSLDKQENVLYSPAVGISSSPPKLPKLVHDGPLFFHRNIKIVKFKPFKCFKCPFSTVERDSLALHIRLVHEGVPPQKCGQCWKSFPTLTKLKEHLAREHCPQQQSNVTGDYCDRDEAHLEIGNSSSADI